MILKSKKKRVSTVLSILFVCAIMLSSAFSGYFSSATGSGPVAAEASESVLKRENGKLDKSQLGEGVEEINSISDDEYVNYIIQMDSSATLLNLYEKRSDRSMSYQDYVISRTARINAENIEKTHNALFKQMSKQVKMKFVASYTTLVNAFSVSIQYKDRFELENVAGKSGALSASISNTYEQPMYELVDNEVDVWENTGIFQRPEDMLDDSGNKLYPELAEYQGEGMFIAVLDTGFDYTHAAFSEDNLPKVTGTDDIDDSKLKVDYNYVKKHVNAYSPVLGMKDNKKDDANTRYLENATADDFYVNKKVPFAFDYADFDTEVVTTEEYMHGTHVAGIIVGRSDDPVGKVDPIGRKVTGIEGVAPLAQLAAMKVFSEQRGGTDDIFLLPALEDCVTLGVDVMNLSLGSTSGLTDHENPTMTAAYQAIGRAGISLVVAAGNSHSSASGGHYGLNLPTSPDSGVVAAPSSFYEAFSVASIQGNKAPYFRALNASGQELGIAYFNESANPAAPYGYNSYNFADNLYNAVMSNPEYQKYYTPDPGNSDIGTIKVPYVAVPGNGDINDYSNLTGSNSVKGKIALIRRGTTSFIQKLTNARSREAIAGIVYNNASGIFGMSIDDTVGIPSCAITMAAAAPFKDVKNGYIEFRVEKKVEGTFEERRSVYGAGPFMSIFSSWGAMADLSLKPEITGHGGEIYSAAPGEDNYARISGTSMASPNVAGLVAIARQYLKEPANVAKFKLQADSKTIKAEDGIDLNKLENRVYQLLMSTSTIPKNEEGDPYSPRQLGSGLANIAGLMRTDTFLWVADSDGIDGMKDRTKIELQDDKEKTGVFEKKRNREVVDETGKKTTVEIGEDFEFYVRNTGSTPRTYRLKADVMTESLSIDKKTVGEKPYMLNNTIKEWKINDVLSSDGIVTVAAGADVKISVKLTLTEQDKAYIDTSFTNGMFVEGYIRLEPVKDVSGVYQSDSSVPELSLPYLAFYGDWLAAPMFDTSVYDVDKDEKDNSLNEDKKRYAQYAPLQLYGKYIEENTDYSVPLGTMIFYVTKSLSDRVPYATPERTALSLNQHAASEIYYVSGFMRSAKTADWEIRNKVTGQLMASGNKRNVRKNIGLVLEVSPLKIGCQINVTYTLSFKAKLDYPGATYEYCAMDFVIDGDAPMIAKSELRVERNNQGVYQRFLDLELRDDNFLQAMDLRLYDSEKLEYYTLLDRLVSGYDRGLYPLNSDKNSTTKVTFNLTYVWDQIERGGHKMSALIYDMSFNSSYYEFDIKKLLNKAEDKIAFGDIGIYTTYEKKDGSGSKTILTGYNEKIAKDEKGNDKTMSSITVRQYQSIKLNYAIITNDNVWPEDLKWSTTEPDNRIVNINDKGEMFAASAGTTTITVTSGNISTTLKVEVLSQDQLNEYDKLYAINSNTSNLKGVSILNQEPLIEGGIPVKILNAGETYTIEIEPNPWYTDKNNVDVTWSSSDTSVATVTPHATDKYKAVVTAQKGTWGYYKSGVLTPVKLTADGQFAEIDSAGNFIKENNENVIVDNSKVLYFKNYTETKTIIGVSIKSKTSATVYSDAMYIYAKKEFAIDGGSLTAYNGTDKYVYLPTNLSITSIGRMAFASNHNVEHVIVPEGVERIEYGAFYYMKKLQSVKLPSTIKFINDWAFAAYSSLQGGIYTELKVVDTTAFVNPVHLKTRVFQNQAVLGSDATKYENGGYYWPRTSPDRNERYEFYDKSYTKLDTKNFRSIGSLSFNNCESLTDLDLTGLRFVGQQAFRNIGTHAAQVSSKYDDFTEKKYLEIEFSETTALSYAMFYTAGMQKLTLPMRRIANTAFLDCPFLEDVTFESDNLIVESEAFKACFYSLTSDYHKAKGTITFNGTVEYIGDEAFSYTSAPPTEITNLVFNKTVKHIGASAFSGMCLQPTLTLPDGLESIGKDAFSNISTLEKVIIPAGVTASLDLGQAFYFTPNFKTIEVETRVGVSDNCYAVRQVAATTTAGANTQVDVLTYISGANEEMVLIPNGQDVSKFTVPKEITVLREGAFGFSLNLTEIDFEEEVGVSRDVKMAPYAMAYMPKLKKVTLPSGLTEIPEGLFYKSGARNMAGYNSAGIAQYVGSTSTILVVENTDNILTVGDSAFEYSGLDTIVLPNCVSIGKYAFAESKLISFVIPEGVTEIADYAFYGITALENVKLHDKVTKIGEYAFAGIAGTNEDGSGDRSNKLTTILEEDAIGVLEIGEGAFSLCTRLDKVAFSAVEKIGDLAFYARPGKGSITGLKISDVLTVGASMAENQSRLTSVGVYYATKIGDYAFANTGITSISFGYAEIIGEGAFYNSKLSGSVEIITRVKEIGDLAFARTNITGFIVNSGNVGGYYAGTDGVLFRTYENEMKELVAYPAGSPMENSYEIPEGIVRVAEYAFFGVQNLSFVTLPSTLKFIGHKAFFASNISTYRFMSYQAPILEAEITSFDFSDQNDQNVYYWSLYANFYSYFSPYVAEIIKNSDEKVTGAKFSSYRYNAITSYFPNDSWKSDNALNAANSTITGAGNHTGLSKYGLIMIRPGNGIGYTDFVYAYYFDSVFLGTETLEENTQKVINTINELPVASTVNNYAQAIKSKPAADAARSEYNLLTLGQRTFVTNIALLTALEDKINQQINSTTYYDVVFRANGTVSRSEKIARGERVRKPANPTNGNLQFLGWYNGEDLFEFEESDEIFENVQLIDPETGKPVVDPETSQIVYVDKPVYVSKAAITSNIELNAKFSSNTVTVRFVGENVSVSQKTVTIGQAVAKPDDPQRDGFVFDGWFIGDTKYDFETAVTEDIVLTARWTEEGCGCGSISVFSGSSGLFFGLLTLAALLALTGMLLVKRKHTKLGSKE